MGIFEKSFHIDPKYNHLDRYVKVMYKGFWTPAKYEKNIKSIDIPYFNTQMDFLDQEAIRRCIMAVAIVEDKIKAFWGSLANDIPQTLVGDVGGLFSMSEVTHRRSYHALSEGLNIDLDSLSTHPALEGRVKYLAKYLEKDPKIIGKKRILKKLVLFTSLVERCSLFTQFYILMSYANSNRGLKTISALQQSTAIEEDTHYLFGIDLINIIKEEYPQLWSDYLVELIEENIKAAYTAELNLIDWFFEHGVPEHLTKEEVVNFLNHNFNRVSTDLELSCEFNYDQEMFEEKSMWMVEKTTSPVEPDFFDNAVGSYSSEEEDLDLTKFNF